MLAEQGYVLSELDCRLTQMIRIGVIQDVDYEKAKVKVKIGENITDGRPWLTKAGRLKTWNPPVIGEQVLVLSPGGDFEQSIVLPSLYYNKFKAPSDQKEELKVELSKDNHLTWNADKDYLKLKLSEEGVFEVEIDDRWIIFEKEGFTFHQKDTEVHIEDGHIRFRNDDNQINIDKNGVHIATPDASFSLKKDQIVFKTGAQTLKLTSSGLFLNDLPLIPSPV